MGSKAPIANDQRREARRAVSPKIARYVPSGALRALTGPRWKSGHLWPRQDPFFPCLPERTLGSAATEGSRRIPTLFPTPCRIREFSRDKWAVGVRFSILNYQITHLPNLAITQLPIYQMTPSLSRCRPESRAHSPAPEQFPCIVLVSICSCRHTLRG
jgi:hypothetical protein